MEGLEPPRLSAPDPKSGTATNYATSAIFQIPLPYFSFGYSRLVGIVPLAFLRNAVSRTITPHPQYFKFHFPISASATPD